MDKAIATIQTTIIGPTGWPTRAALANRFACGMVSR
jgi:hypothetical protein